jgi:hypothetical protein
MIADLESHAAELRFLPGIKDVDIVPFPSGKELWVILSHPIELDKLQKASASSGCTVVKSGWLPSKLPRSLAEMIWDGVMYVVAKEAHGWKRFGFTRSSMATAKIARDLVTGDTIYHVNNDEGLAILRDYLKD